MWVSALSGALYRAWGTRASTSKCGEDRFFAVRESHPDGPQDHTDGLRSQPAGPIPLVGVSQRRNHDFDRRNVFPTRRKP